jgi:hypothetical protein
MSCDQSLLQSVFRGGQIALSNHLDTTARGEVSDSQGFADGAKYDWRRLGLPWPPGTAEFPVSPNCPHCSPNDIPRASSSHVLDPSFSISRCHDIQNVSLREFQLPFLIHKIVVTASGWNRRGALFGIEGTASVWPRLVFDWGGLWGLRGLWRRTGNAL